MHGHGGCSVLAHFSCPGSLACGSTQLGTPQVCTAWTPPGLLSLGAPESAGPGRPRVCAAWTPPGLRGLDARGSVWPGCPGVCTAWMPRGLLSLDAPDSARPGRQEQGPSYKYLPGPSCLSTCRPSCWCLPKHGWSFLEPKCCWALSRFMRVLCVQNHLKR